MLQIKAAYVSGMGGKSRQISPKSILKNKKQLSRNNKTFLTPTLLFVSMCVCEIPWLSTYMSLETDFVKAQLNNLCDMRNIRSSPRKTS